MLTVGKFKVGGVVVVDRPVATGGPLNETTSSSGDDGDDDSDCVDNEQAGVVSIRASGRLA